MKKADFFLKKKYVILLKKKFGKIIFKIIQVISNQYQNFVNFVNYDKAKI